MVRYLLLIHNRELRVLVEKAHEGITVKCPPNIIYFILNKACPSESGTEVGVPLFPAVELCDFSGDYV
jgi:hypothetical protein